MRTHFLPLRGRELQNLERFCFDFFPPKSCEMLWNDVFWTFWLDFLAWFAFNCPLHHSLRCPNFAHKRKLVSLCFGSKWWKNTPNGYLHLAPDLLSVHWYIPGGHQLILRGKACSMPGSFWEAERLYPDHWRVVFPANAVRGPVTKCRVLQFWCDGCVKMTSCPI